MKIVKRLLTAAALYFGLSVSCAFAAPLLTEVTPVPPLSTDTTPQVVVNTTEVADIVYGGSCGNGNMAQLPMGDTTVTYSVLADGTYNDCTLTGTNPVTFAVSNVLTLSAFTIDTTPPVFTSVDLLNEVSDGVITASESASGAPAVGNLVASGYSTVEYLIADSSATCSSLGGYTVGAFSINEVTIDGNQKFCVKLNDAVGNVTYGESASFVRDTAIPAFSSIGVTSSNPFDASYGRQGSALTFTLQLAAADSYAGGGSIDVNIGTTNLILPFTQVASTSALNTYTATHTITTENGTITINGVTFADAYGQAMTGFVAGAPTPTVTIDSVSPSITSATVSTTGNAGWARAGQTVTYTLGFSEDILGSPVTATTAFNVGAVVQKDFNYVAFVTSGTIEFAVTAGDNGAITINNANISLQDRAGNSTTLTAAMINALVGAAITADTTVPTISGVSIFSNNALDTALAKTNDTITIALTTADNLSPTLALNGASHILNHSIVDNVSGAPGAGSIYRFTDGTETSQVVVPFGLGVTDEAGNASAWITATNDGSSVRFDRTNPVVQNVRISAVSQDGSAYLGDVPTYYAKRGDDITLRFEGRDWVDLLPGGITGTLFGIPVSLTKTNPACDGSVTWCEWTTTIINVDGTEGVVPFDILVLDNAGNGDGTTNPELHITGTTDGSRVIFDKTTPVNPTDVVDRDGSPTTSFKAGTSAIYTWTNDSDPLPASGANSGVWKYYVAFTNPDNGGEVHSGSLSTLSQETVSLYDNAGNLVGSRYYDATISDLAPWTGQLIPPRNITPVYYPYQLRMITVDKAGNMPYTGFGDVTQLASTQPQVVYEQPYTITIYGTVTGLNGEPVRNALVQVSARYGEFCDAGKEVCTDMTDSLGRYSVLVNKDQDYNITFYANGYYTNKKDRSIADDYFLLDVSLSAQDNIHEFQDYESIIYLTLSDTIPVGEHLEYVQFEIYTNSGQITTRQEGDTVVINSLSTITKIREILPWVGGFITPADTPKTLVSPYNSVTITRTGNEWRITGAGSVIHHNGTETDYDTDQYYNGYGDRLSMVYTPGNGNHSNSGDLRSDLVMDGHIYTEEEVKRDLERIDAGNAPKIIYYTNFNGYQVFAGYQSGKLPIEKCGERYTNRVRLGANATVGEHDLAGKMEEMKDVAGSAKEEEMDAVPKSEFEPLVRRREGEEVRSALALRQYNNTKVDKFARYNPNSNPSSTKIAAKDYGSIRMNLGGKSVSMQQVTGLSTGGY